MLSQARLNYYSYIVKGLGNKDIYFHRSSPCPLC